MSEIEGRARGAVEAVVDPIGVGVGIHFPPTEEAKQASRERYATVFRNSPVAISISRLADGGFLDVNEAFLDLYGYSRAEVIGHTSEELGLWHSANRAAVVLALREEKRRQIVEIQGRCKSGSIRDLLASIELVRIDDEWCLVGFLFDITERKRGQAALRESEERYRAVVEDQTEVICRFKAGGEFIFVNEVYCRFFGKVADQLIGRQWQPVAVAEDVPEIERKLKSLSPSNPVVVIENRVHSGDGRVCWMQFINRAFFDAGGRLIEIQSVGRDITERKRAEEALRASEEKFRLVAETIHDVFWMSAPDLSRLLYVSAAYEVIWGRSCTSLYEQPRSFIDAVHPEDRDRVAANLRAPDLDHQQEFEIEYRIVQPDGGVRWIRDRGFPVRDAAGRCLQMVGVATDITAQKQLAAERAAALARLAVVEEQERRRFSRELHDQTAQRIVALAVELKTLETNLASGRAQVARVQSLRKAVDDLQQQVRQMAWDLRAGELARGGLESALREYIEEWSERVGVPVDCECRGLRDDPLPVIAETALYRAAQEALTNVEKHAGARRVSVLVECDETLARLTVEDDGRGFEVEAVPTAPDTAQHLGLLGLRERVALAGGTFLIESSPGTGTTILVRIPISDRIKSL